MFMEGREEKIGFYPCCLFVPLVLLALGVPRAQGYLWIHENPSALFSSQNLGAGTEQPMIPATPLEVTYLGSQGALDLLWGQR